MSSNVQGSGQEVIVNLFSLIDSGASYLLVEKIWSI